MEVQEVLGRVTEYLVQGYRSPPRTKPLDTDRTISAHSPDRRRQADQAASSPPRHKSPTEVPHTASAPADTVEPAKPSAPRTPTRTTAPIKDAGAASSPQPSSRPPAVETVLASSPPVVSNKDGAKPLSPASKGSRTPTATTPKQTQPTAA